MALAVSALLLLPLVLGDLLLVSPTEDFHSSSVSPSTSPDTWLQVFCVYNLTREAGRPVTVQEGAVARAEGGGRGARLVQVAQHRQHHF